MGLSYVCENSMAVPKSCDFRSGKIILQQEIATDQMKKLLHEGRTDLLPGFKSSRTGRFFKAYLVKGPEGKILIRIRAAQDTRQSGLARQPPRQLQARALRPRRRQPRRLQAPRRQTTAPTMRALCGAKKVAAKKAAAKKVTAKKVAGQESRGQESGHQELSREFVTQPQSSIDDLHGVRSIARIAPPLQTSASMKQLSHIKDRATRRYCAIDFGTSNSAIAIPVTRADGQGGTALIALEGEQLTMPSAVFYDSEDATSITVAPPSRPMSTRSPVV